MATAEAVGPVIARRTVSVVDPRLITVGSRFRKDLGDIDTLVASIRDVGLIHPIVIDTKNHLIAGERRLAACLRLGLPRVPVTMIALDADEERLRIEHDENVLRADFTPSEAVAIARALKEREQAAAKARMVDAHASPAKFAQQDTGRVRDKAATLTGYSHETIRKATAVVDAATADPTLAPVLEEMDRTGKVDPAYKKVRKTPGQMTEEERKLLWKAEFEREKAEERRERRKVWQQNAAENEDIRRALRNLLGKCEALPIWEDVALSIEFELSDIDEMLAATAPAEAAQP